MKPVLALILLCFFTACASKPNENIEDMRQAKADAKARDDFAKSLPKPAER
jgi:hypothetical protein